MSSASRAGLGIPRIDTNIDREFGTLHSPRVRDAHRDSVASRSSTVLPSVRILASTPFEGEDADFDQPESASNALRGRAVRNNHGNPKAKQEMRKLLSHVLTQLVNRTRPPTVADTIKELGRDATEHTVSPFAEVLKDVAKLGKAIQRQTSRKDSVDDDDDDEDNSQVFTTEATFDLMLQLKDLLSMASTGGWQIFEETEYVSIRNVRCLNHKQSLEPFIKTFRGPEIHPVSAVRETVSLVRVLAHHRRRAFGECRCQSFCLCASQSSPQSSQRIVGSKSCRPDRRGPQMLCKLCRLVWPST
jgi:hypothetical protein